MQIYQAAEIAVLDIAKDIRASTYISKATSSALFPIPAVDNGDLHALPSYTEAIRRPPQLKGDRHAPNDSKGHPHALPNPH